MEVRNARPSNWWLIFIVVSLLGLSGCSSSSDDSSKRGQEQKKDGTAMQDAGSDAPSARDGGSDVPPARDIQEMPDYGPACDSGVVGNCCDPEAGTYTGEPICTWNRGWECPDGSTGPSFCEAGT